MLNSISKVREIENIYIKKILFKKEFNYLKVISFLSYLALQR